MGLGVLAFFAVFALGAGGASVIARVRPPGWVLALLIPAALAAYLVLVFQLPFLGLLTEVPLVFLGAAGLAGPMYLFLWVGNEKFGARLRDPQATRDKRYLAAVAGLMMLMLGSAAATMTTITSRVNCAEWLEWACDGPIVEVTHDKGNHNSPMLVVRSEGRTVRFEPVDGDLWGRAKPGQRLTKMAGSPMALLDGVKVRMVPRQMGWLREPP